MQFAFDSNKSRKLRENPQRGIGFEEAKLIFSGDYIAEFYSDDPEQFRATGWVDGKLFTVVYEVRENWYGEYYWLVTLWQATTRERQSYVEHYRDQSTPNRG